MAGPVLQVSGLVAGYGDKLILKGVDLTVERGEVRVVLGGSGCGKSTLMKACIGLITPQQGEITVLGEPLHALEGRARTQLLTRIGVLFQYGALLGSITIGANIALPLREHTDLPDEVIAEMVRLKLAAVELSHAENLLPSELSGGMRKRAALARALALDPELLFCDEPGAGLDPLTSAELDELLLRLRDRFGMAIVVVTHEILSIEKISDKLIYLAKGVPIADGTLQDLKASKEDEVRAFFARKAAGEMRGPVTALEALVPKGQH
jgi:phospholipid/cholesterol/gamma-HCH transport system ATP-binding protein